ncbi:MAG TPA: monofunctional biosynthetic peptidoglycan transglycosylase [Dissulfurispiraceae bacterium]|nr:monofunctional biosynthetic peptidoglycan transglycosylase [Dissulfurispiraceae bacterium]
MRWVKKIIVLCLALALASPLIHFVYPDVGRLAKDNPRKSAFMEYREAEWAEQGKKIKITQSWVGLGRVSPYLVKAVLIGEDDKFYQHEGFDFEAMQKAVEKDIAEKKFKFGGSTISQQLAKNLFLTPSKNPIRKIKEVILTWRIEHALSKKRILELYLNVAEWGEGIFGIEAAARHYYGKSASALGPYEAARLASVLPNPRKYNPLGQSRYVENRSRIIYTIMQRRGIAPPDLPEITEDPAEIAPEDKFTPPPGQLELPALPSAGAKSEFL